MPDTHCESRAGWFFCWLLNIYDDYLFGVTIRFVRRQSSLAPWAGAAVTSARCQRTGCRQLAETNTEQRSRWQIWVKLSHNNTERKLPFVSNPASYFSRCGSCWCSSDEEEAPGSRQSDELVQDQNCSVLVFLRAQSLFIGSAQVYFHCNSQSKCSHQRSRSIPIFTMILKRCSPSHIFSSSGFLFSLLTPWNFSLSLIYVPKKRQNTQKTNWICSAVMWWKLWVSWRTDNVSFVANVTAELAPLAKLSSCEANGTCWARTLNWVMTGRVELASVWSPHPSLLSSELFGSPPGPDVRRFCSRHDEMKDC